MKAALRDVLLILLLFGAIVLAPTVADLFPRRSASPVQAPPAVSAPSTTATANTSEDSRVELRALPGLSQTQVTRQHTPSGAGCGLKSVYGYRSDIPTPKGDMFIISGALSAENEIRFGIIGGGGIDTLKVDGAGYITLNGGSITGVEILDLRNDAPNVVKMFVQGFGGLDRGHLLVIGDAQDTVFLDSCLKWDAPVAVDEGREVYARHDARDEAGNTASVSVTKGVRVEPLRR